MEDTERNRTEPLGRFPKNNSDNCLTIQVPSLFEGYQPDREPRKSHSSPTRHPQRRRYSQGAILDATQCSVFSRDSWDTTPNSYDVDFLRHSSDNLQDVSSGHSNPFASTIALLDHESTASGGSTSVTSSEARRKVTRTPQERLNKLAKRHWPDDHLIPLDDICESPLAKTPNSPVQWSAGGQSGILQQHSTSSTLFTLDSSVTAAATAADKG